MFSRKLYYDNDTGRVAIYSMMEGDIVLTTREQDIETIAELQPYKDNPSALGVMVWTVPDHETEVAFSEATGVRVDVTVMPHQIRYDYTPLPEPTTNGDARAAIDALMTEMEAMLND